MFRKDLGGQATPLLSLICLKLPLMWLKEECFQQFLEQGLPHPGTSGLLQDSPVFGYLADSISLSFHNPHLWICRPIRILQGDLCLPLCRVLLWRGWLWHPQTYMEGIVLSGILLQFLCGERRGKRYFPFLPPQGNLTLYPSQLLSVRKH